MSYAYDPIYDEWNHDEPECLLVDTCPHGVPDDRPCVDCDEDDARFENVRPDYNATMAIYNGLTFTKAGAR